MRFGALAAIVAITTGGCSLIVDAGGLSGGGAPPGPDASFDARDDATVADASADASADAPVTQDAADAAPPTLVADWPFDEGTGTTIGDRSGRGHDGVALGGVWVADHADAGAQALELDGTQFISVLAHPDFDRPADPHLSISAWMRMNDTPSHDMFVSISYGNTDSSYGVELIDATSLTYWDGEVHASTATIPDIGKSWHHYGIAVDGGQVRIYFDGVRVAQGQADTTPRVATQILLGRSNFGDKLNGAVDKIRYHRVALTDAEMLAEKSR